MTNRVWRQIAGITIAFAYTFTWLVLPPRWWPESVRFALLSPRRFIAGLIEDALLALGVRPVTHEWRYGVYFIAIMAVVPAALLALAGRWRPGAYGVRIPNRYGWRVLLVGSVIAVPFLWWMVNSPGFSDRYFSRLERVGATAFLTYYFFVFFSEHLFCQGIVLAMFRADWRWPAAPVIDSQGARGRRRMLTWLGLAQPVGEATGVHRCARWVGLPDGCATAVICGGLLFGAVHIGKDPRELLLSIPGGTALAYLALRCNSFLIPFALHTATASTAFVMMTILADG